MMELLQKKENGKIVMCNLGNFYVAIGKDATLLNALNASRGHNEKLLVSKMQNESKKEESANKKL